MTDANGDKAWCEQVVDEGDGVAVDSAGNCYLTGDIVDIEQYDLSAAIDDLAGDRQAKTGYPARDQGFDFI